ncbi:hypothetical protein H9X88_11990 [Aeromonas hydrophila]|uniref:hypothetical protein n=1 Tax=Aeromonas hydrophila TaxID=644 RepID=UPI001B39E635|nr:hypothetical protein [Aeromonas hydrophila]MBQ4676984.1 hypothetical protein [Aeromonas hydrophila]MBW3813587.1 hypothetical protein [Aeromonas hydrophila]MCF7678818.1 hypothetical protein [Aeromonas hydrophila]MCF7691866.1 hypothetical protein [Aeromonas hydrophila]MCF7772666.1 hypothetical protein [Aeromonas hydrophila]
MQMVPREQFLPTVRLHITGPLEMLLEEAVTETAITFCRESELITLDRLLPSASAGSLEAVCNVDGVTSCNVLHLTGADGVLLDSGRDYFALSANELSILTDLDDVRIWYVAAPVKGAKELPAQLYIDHSEAIAHGVAALLYAQPDRPWSDPKRANYHRAEFVEGWRRAGRFRKQHSAPTQVEFYNPPRKHSFF